jgi:hypothetical protein
VVLVVVLEEIKVRVLVVQVIFNQQLLLKVIMVVLQVVRLIQVVQVVVEPVL